MNAKLNPVLWSLGLLTVIAAVAVSVSATATQQVPEIDATSITAGVGLLAGGVMILRARMRRK